MEQASSAEQVSSSQSESVGDAEGIPEENASSQTELKSPPTIEELMITLPTASVVEELADGDADALYVVDAQKQGNWVAYIVERFEDYVLLYNTISEETQIVYRQSSDSWGIDCMHLSEKRLSWVVHYPEYVVVMSYKIGSGKEISETRIDRKEGYSYINCFLFTDDLFYCVHRISEDDISTNTIISGRFGENSYNEIYTLPEGKTISYNDLWMQSHYLYWFDEGERYPIVMVLDQDDPSAGVQMVKGNTWWRNRMTVFNDTLLIREDNALIELDLVTGEKVQTIQLQRAALRGTIVAERFYAYYDYKQKMICFYDLTSQRDIAFAPARISLTSEVYLFNCGDGLLLHNLPYNNEVQLFTLQKRNVASYTLPRKICVSGEMRDGCWYSRQEGQMCIIDFRDVIDSIK